MNTNYECMSCGAIYSTDTEADECCQEDCSSCLFEHEVITNEICAECVNYGNWEPKLPPV